MRQRFYDVFINHAHEDDGSFVNELVLALKESGLRVWYMSTELKLKTCVTTSITSALKQAQYGIIIFSPAYLSKNWAIKELEALLANKKTENRILLVLSQVSVKLLKEKKSTIADKYTISSRRGVSLVHTKVLDVIADMKSEVSGRSVLSAGDKEENPDVRNAGIIVLGGDAGY